MKKKLPGLARTAAPDASRATKAKALRDQLPAATGPGRRSAGEGELFQLTMPPETLRDLKIKALDGKTSVRALILEALRKAGHTVPAGEAIDRRRVRG